MGSRKSRKKHGKRKKLGFLQIVIILVLILVLIIAWTVGGIFWKFYKDTVDIVPADEVDPKAESVKIAQEEQKSEDVFNIMLVGTDTRDPDADMGRSDSMMLVSYNKQENKATVVSFLRDSLVEIDGYGKSRLGHTYAYGGVGLTINTINQTYGLDIQNYVTISFDNLVNIIDELGGITVNITEEEAEYYRENGMPDIISGNVTLTGSQALAHARNRTLGSDFERTRRQRDVLYGIYNKIMQEKDPTTILPLIEYCMNQVSTNMSVTDIYSLATEVMGSENLTLQQAGIPQEGMYTPVVYEGMDVLEIDVEACKEYLKKSRVKAEKTKKYF